MISLHVDLEDERLRGRNAGAAIPEVHFTAGDLVSVTVSLYIEDNVTPMPVTYSGMELHCEDPETSTSLFSVPSFLKIEDKGITVYQGTADLTGVALAAGVERIDALMDIKLTGSSSEAWTVVSSHRATVKKKAAEA